MNNLINISEGTSLAFHGLALIAARAPERMNVKSVAAELHASEAHLAKVFQKLNRAGFIASVRGPAGGFELNRPAEEITFLNVYEVLEAPVELDSCPLGRKMCSFHSCIFEERMQKISREIYNSLKEIRLSDFNGSNSQERREALRNPIER